MRHRRSRWQLVFVALVAVIGIPAAAQAAPKLDDYRLFRALSIDLLGRMPTRQEVAAFESPYFEMDKWIDDHLAGPQYADRLTHVYADLLRLDVNNFRYNQQASVVGRAKVQGPDGHDIYIYFRPSQKRPRDPKNAGFCMTSDEIGLDLKRNPPLGQAIPITQELLDQYTTVVKPWWLYADYAGKTPQDRYDAVKWAQRYPGYVLNKSLLVEPDGKTDTTEIRICNEEASVAATGNRDGKTEKVSCLTAFGTLQSSECGCGPGLERCQPWPDVRFAGQPAIVAASKSVLLGVDDPTDQTSLGIFDWQNLWLSQEALQYFNHVFADDRDFREVLTGRYTYVNGPLNQFYRFQARTTWRDFNFNYNESTPLVDPAKLPANLPPYDAQTWTRVEDRGPLAAGILTMPEFLMKYATRRSRAHAVYNVFMCRDFVAPGGLQLPPSKEPNLMKRDGCAACHQTLEPLSAYFARIVESDWNWLDPSFYPVVNDKCRTPGTPGPAQPGVCTSRYDPAFSTPNTATLRGAYGSLEHAEAGPVGLAQALVAKPDFARCVAQNVATSFLGRSLRTEDDALQGQMVEALVGSGFRVRPMMRVLLHSDAYRNANNLSSSAWRKGGAK